MDTTNTKRNESAKKGMANPYYESTLIDDSDSTALSLRSMKQIKDLHMKSEKNSYPQSKENTHLEDSENFSVNVCGEDTSKGVEESSCLKKQSNRKSRSNNTGKPLKKERGMKRNLAKQYDIGLQKKKAKPILAYDREKAGEQDSLSKVDAFSLAVRMGYPDPHDKSYDNGVDQQFNREDQEDEETSRKLSPVENIQQVIDYKSSTSCSCLRTLTIQDLSSHRLEIATLDRQARDFFIMGLFRSSAIPSNLTSKNCDRQRYRFNYRIMNTPVCQLCFLFVNNIGAKYMKNLKKHFNEVGVKSRTHGNQGRKPHHALQVDNVVDVTEFVSNYAATHGTPAPRPPKNAKSKRTIRLPSSESFSSIYKLYKEMCEETGKRGIASSTFRKIWSSHAPHIKVVKPNISKEPVSSSGTQGVPSQPAVGISATADTHQPQTHDDIKKVLKDKVKETAVSLSLKNPSIPCVPPGSVHNDGMPPPSQVSIPFDLSSVDVGPTSLMPLGMYFNDPSGSTDPSWQHNLLLPHSHPHMAPSQQAHMASDPQGTRPCTIQRAAAVMQSLSSVPSGHSSSNSISSLPSMSSPQQRLKYTIPGVQTFQTPHQSGGHVVNQPW